MTDWLAIDDPDLGVRFRHPAHDAEGSPVERTDGKRDGAVRIHLQSADRQEVYFEATRYPNGTADADWAALAAELRERFPDVQVSSLAPGLVAGHEARTGRFRWAQRERAVSYVALPGALLRFIHDPRSDTNRQILTTVEITIQAS